MIKLIIVWGLWLSMIVPVSALELSSPEVPPEIVQQMPEETESFADGFLRVLQVALESIFPNLRQAGQTAVSVICAVILLALIQPIQGSTKRLTEMAGSVVVTFLLVSNANSMIILASDTIQELSDYGKLLCPVMTTAMAAQGGMTTAAALYAGTAFFDSMLCRLISGVLVPVVYMILTLATANSALGEPLLKRMCEAAKKAVSWLLKTVLTVFTTFMSISGVISGTTDAAALKATKVTISSVVPVIGGILSDASEAVLLSADMAKNAAGVYGILAILAVFLTPFLQIGCHYVVLKIVAAVSCVLGPGSISGLIEEYSAAMGILLGMTASMCLIQLVSTVCFLRSVG